MKLNLALYPLVSLAVLTTQAQDKLMPNLKLGFSHTLFSSLIFHSSNTNSLLTQENETVNFHKNIKEINYGFGIGLFLWAPINERIIFKPKIEGCFSNVSSQFPKPALGTSFDLVLSYGLVINLKSEDHHGIIYLARDMSCYLTTKQPYVLLGQVATLKKYDLGYLHKGYKNELMYGFYVGYGINYEFHGTNFAPEIYYSISKSVAKNTIESDKTTHTITLALNIF